MYITKRFCPGDDHAVDDAERRYFVGAGSSQAHKPWWRATHWRAPPRRTPAHAFRLRGRTTVQRPRAPEADREADLLAPAQQLASDRGCLSESQMNLIHACSDAPRSQRCNCNVKQPWDVLKRERKRVRRSTCASVDPARDSAE